MIISTLYLTGKERSSYWLLSSHGQGVHREQTVRSLNAYDVLFMDACSSYTYVRLPCITRIYL